MKKEIFFFIFFYKMQVISTLNISLLHCLYFVLSGI